MQIKHKKEVKELVERLVSKYVEHKPFFLNPDKVVSENIIDGLVRNIIKYGCPYCPCREVEGIPEKDKNNICPCLAHKEDISQRGTCECGLFVSETYIRRK